MKKLMIALAAAATTMFSFGDLPTGTSFEALTEGPVDVGGVVNKDDSGDPSGSEFYWYSTAPASDELGAITNDVASGVSRPDLFANQNQANTKSLQIDTTAPLVRTALPNAGASSVTGVTIGDGIYLDTLVKFTAADEAFAENLTGGDKIAIEYVEHEAEGDDVGYTNFVIRAGFVGGSEIVQTNYFAAVPAGFNKDAWHRLTVRTIANVGDDNVGFVIYLDGDMTKTLEYSTNVDAGFGTLNALAQTFYNSEKHALFPSAIAAGATGGSTISSVAFSGNGFIDDVSFTATKPSFINEAILVTIEWDEHVTGMTINNTVLTAEQVAAKSWTGEPNEGSVIAIPTFETGYVAGAPVLPEGATYNSETKTFGNLTAGMTCTIKSMFPLYEVNGVAFDDLEDALTAAAEGTAQNPATLKLLADCSEGISFGTGTFVIIDLAGHNIQGTDEDSFSIACKLGANVVVTNSIPATGAVKVSLMEDATVAMSVKDEGTVVSVYDTKFEGYISVKDGGDLKIYSGIFYDDDAEGVENLRYNPYIQGTPGVTPLGGGYFQVGGGEEPPTPTSVAVPEALIGIIYDGTLKTGVVENVGYTLTGNTGTDAGSYEATATLATGYIWSDNSTTNKTISWGILPNNQAEVVVTLTSEIAEYSAQLEFPAASATIGGVAVEGTTNWVENAISEPEAGATNTYTVTFTVTTANYAGSTGTATFKVYKAAGGGSDYPSYIDDNIAYKDAYDTWKTDNNVAAGDNQYATAFLLNIAPDATDQTLEPVSITMEGGKVVISANQTLTAVNGKVYVKVATTLAGLATAEWTEATLDEGKVQVTPGSSDTAGFYKIKVDF